MAYHQQDLSLGIAVDTDQFDPCTGTIWNHPNADELNAVIAKAKDCVEDIVKHFEVVEKRRPLKAEVLDIFTRDFNGVGFISSKSTMKELIEQFCKEGVAKKAWSSETTDKFEALLKNLQEFDSRVNIEKFSEGYLQKIVDWYVEHGYTNTTIYKKIGFIKWFLSWCKSKGIYKGNAHEKFTCMLKGANYEQKTIVYLEREELNALEEFDFSDKPYLDRARDIFVFACYCGLRYSDVSTLEQSQIYGKAIHVVAEKTDNKVSIELNSHTTRILAKYHKENCLNKRVLPVPSNQKMNDYIKEACKLAGIDQEIKLVYFKGNEKIEKIVPKYKAMSFHASRRTFITMALLLEIPVPVIMQWSGHKRQESLKPYMKVVDELRKKQMSKFDGL